MVMAVVLGATSSWIFILVLLFTLSACGGLSLRMLHLLTPCATCTPTADFEQLLTSAAGPLLTVYYQATGNMAGATCLVLINTMCQSPLCSCCVDPAADGACAAMAFTTQGLMTVASRMTMAVARDGLFGRISRPFTTIHPRLKVPVWSICLVAGFVVVFGLIL